ncbi:MAG: hypothetical protein WA045_10450 [Nitrospira sp.]
MSQRWIQLRSDKNGKKWLVREDQLLYQDVWPIVHDTDPRRTLHVPLCDYELCDPPEPPKQWVDVTRECTLQISTIDGVYSFYHLRKKVSTLNGYRVREYGWKEYFIVEKLQ